MRPTGGGVAAVVGAVALTVAGWALGYVELLVLAACCGLALVVGVVWVLPTARLDVTRTLEPDRVERGGAASVTLDVVSAARRPFAGRASDRIAGRWVPVALPARGRGEPYDLPAQRRGRYRVGPLVLTRTDPLRLVRRDAVLDLRADLWVHPHRLRVPVNAAGLVRDLEGPAPDTAAEGSISFQSLREYVPGDDLRRVHWRSTARTGTLMVRQYVDPSRPDLALVLDDRAAVYSGDDEIEGAVDVVASLVAHLREQGFSCSLHLLSGSSVLGGAGLAPVRDAFDGLSEVVHGGDVVVEAGLSRLGAAAAAVLVTGRPSAADLESLGALRRHFPRVVALCVTSEQVPPPRGVQVVCAPTPDAVLRAWSRQVAVGGRR